MNVGPLLVLPSDPMVGGGVVDYLGRPASRASSGGWTAALFLMGALIPERMVFYGISGNLISFLTGPLQESTAGAAAAVNAWVGASAMLSPICAFVADSYWGRFRTAVFASLLYILGLAMLTISATLPSFTADQAAAAAPPSQVALFYFSLYMVAVAHGHKPCLQALGADQFDGGDPKEFIARSAFFNWWYFGTCSGTVLMVALLSYVQDNMGWGLGFGIPCLAMVLSLAVLLLGTRTYRFQPVEAESPFARVGKACLAVAGKRLRNLRATADEEDKELLLSDIRQVEEAKGLLRLFPIWVTCWIYAVVFSQPSTLFTKQGGSMERRVGPNFQVPPGGDPVLRQAIHHPLPSSLRPDRCASGEEAHEASLGLHDASEDRHRAPHSYSLLGDGSAGGDEEAQSCSTVRPGRSAGCGGSDEHMVAGAAECSAGDHRSFISGRLAGVLLRPSPHCAEELRHQSFTDHLRHRLLCQRTADIFDRRNH